MKSTIFLFLIACFALAATEKEINGALGFDFGINVAEAKKIAKDKGLKSEVDKPELLIYKLSSFGGLKEGKKLSLFFLEDSLYSIIIDFWPDHNFQIFELYEKVNNKVKKVYGEPDKEVFEIDNKYNANNNKDIIRALANEDGDAFKFWYTFNDYTGEQKCFIYLAILPDDEELNICLNYMYIEMYERHQKRTLEKGIDDF